MKNAGTALHLRDCPIGHLGYQLPISIYQLMPEATIRLLETDEVLCSARYVMFSREDEKSNYVGFICDEEGKGLCWTPIGIGSIEGILNAAGYCVVKV
jgi:hypothetical protein